MFAVRHRRGNGSRRSRSFLLAIALIVGGAGTPLTAFPQDRAALDVPHEYRVKAAFIVQLAQLVEWPAPALPPGGSEFVVVVAGRDHPIERALRELDGELVHGRHVVVRAMDSGSTSYSGHVLFLPRDVPMPPAGWSVLTIGERNGFAEGEGIVNLAGSKGKVGLEINPAAAASAGLRISSKILRLARIVRERT